MLLNASRLRPGAVITCDLCVVGAGPAGLTAASWFARSRAAETGTRPHVVMLEGNPDEASELMAPAAESNRRGIGVLHRRWSTTSQHRYLGTVGGWLAEARPDYLTSSRLRGFGGTSQVWSGWWLPLRETDFSRPFGTDGSQWPIDADDLLPYYRAVHDELGLGPFCYDELDSTLPVGASLSIRTILVSRVDFGTRLRAALTRSPNIVVYFDANVTGLRTSGGAGDRSVEEVVVRADGGSGEFVVRATNVVLAAGALENARLLMLSELGRNSHLGHHFREHPYVWTAARIDVGQDWRRTHPLYCGDLPVPFSENVGRVAALVDDDATSRKLGTGSFRAVLGGGQGVPGTISLCWEQSCGRGSRAFLDADSPPDDLGLPRLRIEPEVTDTDRHTGSRALADVLAALAELGIKPIEVPPLAADPWTWRQPGRVTAGNHPMGVTRMAMSPADGVADPYCRVFGSSNLYLTGSGLFPRGGHANPTLTIVALAARLGAHLSSAR